MGILIPCLPGSPLSPRWSPSPSPSPSPPPPSVPLDNCLAVSSLLNARPQPCGGRLFLGAGQCSQEQGEVSRATSRGEGGQERREG